MAVCEKCGTESARTTTIFRPDGDHVFCRLCKPRQMFDTAKNPFEGFVCEHVMDEKGQKVKINSLKELRAAESRYGFALAVASDDDSLARTPPQHDTDAGNLAKNYTMKWNRDPNAYSQSAVDEAKNNLGVVDGRDKTLVDHPNPLNR